MRLYASKDLLDGYVPGDPDSYAKTWDFRQFAAFIGSGGPTTDDEAVALRQADHDASINVALGAWLKDLVSSTGATPRIVGIMGGHGVLRTEPAFKVIADLARSLTRSGYVIATGGGPGAIEAGHLGAYFARSTDGAYAAAFNDLAAQPRLADLSAIVKKDGSIDPAQGAAIHAGYDWLTAALTARGRADGDPGVSLAVPTWLYGSEPTTPFATAYAKYYQNSIREEKLIPEGQTGVIYAQGGGGTLREIFQTVEKNYYVGAADQFTPMIFVDPGGFWQTEATFDASGNVSTRGIKLDDMLGAIFAFAIKPGERAACLAKLLFGLDSGEIERLLSGHAPMAQRQLSLMLDGVAANAISARFLR